jgi:hypothetical protein
MNMDEHAKDKKSASLFIYLAIFAALLIINTLLVAFGEVPYPNAPGGVGLYTATAFMIAFALWFGGWGVIAAYIGCFIGAGMIMGLPVEVNLYWSLADLWQALIPLVAFKTFDAEVGLKTRRDLWIFLCFGWLFNNVVGAGWGASMLALGGFVSWTDASGIFTGWLTGNLIVTIVITPLLLHYVSPYLQRAGVCVKRYWA